MDVSTRAPAPGGVRSGLRAALGTAAWTAPLLAPLGALQALLVASPWLTSIEAARQDMLLSSAADWRMREALQTTLSVVSGAAGAAVIAALLVLGWLLVLALRGPLRSSPPWRLHGGTHRDHALRLLAGLAGCAGCLVAQPSATRLNLLVDSATSLRPTGAASLALLAGTQVLGFVAIGAILGAALALARTALVPRVRLGALAGLAAIVAATVVTQAGARALVARRFDAGATLSDALGSKEAPRPITLLVLARDRSWTVPMTDGLSGVRFSAGAALRAEALLDRRRGWTTLGAQLDAFAIGERLAAFDPEGARERAMASLSRLARPATGHALLVALGSAAPSPQTRRIAKTIESSPDLHVGPQALLLLAQAHAQSGDLGAAERALARVRAGSERLLVAARVGAPVVLNRFAGGSVSGTLHVDGRPHAGRVGLVATKDLFSLPDEGDVAVTWLLRLVAAGDADAAGRFEIRGLPQGEMALVLLVPGQPHQPRPLEAELPRIDLSPSEPAVELGLVRVAIGPGTR